MGDAIGWGAAIVLVATIWTQVGRQYFEGTSKGVSIWLFIGEMVGSGGFVAAALMLDPPSMVFAVANALIFVAGVAGLFILLGHRRAERASADAPAIGS